MKTITVTSVSYTPGSPGSITIEGTVADVTFDRQSQQITILDQPAGNAAWSRALRLVSQAFQCLRYGVNSVAMYATSWSKIAVAIEPLLTWAPRLSTQPTNVSVAHGGNTSFSVVQNVLDELTATFAWYRSSNSGAAWTHITAATTPNDGCTYGGYTTDTLTITAAVIGMAGYEYRCVATTAAGSITSSSAVLTVT